MGWPELDGPTAAATCSTLRLWSQLVGKTVLAFAPMMNHWWQIALRVSARGLLTPAIPYGTREFQVELDLVSHELHLRSSDGSRDRFALVGGSLAEFYERYFAGLGRLGVSVTIHPMAVEMPELVRLDADRLARAYDPDWARRFFVALVQADRLLTAFRSRFVGKASPVHFFWGSFDLAASRFSGRRAPAHPGGVPHCPDHVMREAYSHEVSSAGFWPGDARFGEAAFYSYVYPEPPGFARAAVLPDAARYEAALGEFVLPYAAVSNAASPDAEVLAFLDSSYERAAELGGWDRRNLERPRPVSEPVSSTEWRHERHV